LFVHWQINRLQGGKMTYAGIPVENKPPPLALGAIEMHQRKQKKPGAYPLRCLVVDDDGIVLKFVSHMLTLIGFQKVDTAQKKPELMDKLATGPYDLLVTDLEMPDMNGFHLSRMIKKEVHDTKVIIMTGRHKTDCLDMMESEWVDNWLFKPFGLNELYHKLRELGLSEQ
jgi:DNA-binding response OmpR family regulator